MWGRLLLQSLAQTAGAVKRRTNTDLPGQQGKPAKLFMWCPVWQGSKSPTTLAGSSPAGTPGRLDRAGKPGCWGAGGARTRAFHPQGRSLSRHHCSGSHAPTSPDVAPKQAVTPTTWDLACQRPRLIGLARGAGVWWPAWPGPPGCL